MNRGRPMQSSDVQLRVVHATDKGGVRGNNEDFYSVPPYTNLQPAPPRLSQAQFDRKGVLYVVADGMGGALSGEVASPMAVRTLVETYYRDPGEDLQTSLWRAFHEANLAVYRHSLTAPQFQGMGTTLTAMVLHGDTVYWANVGDSRLYRLRGGHLDRISKDHTYVQELVDKGVLTLEEARVHPQRNELKRAMGTQPEVDVDAGRVDLKVGDLFLLSSDGLHDELSDEQIRATLVQDPARSPQLLIQQAMLPQGGPDNITAVVVGVPRDKGLVGPATGIDLTRVLRQTAASLMVVTALVAFVKYKDRLLGAPVVAKPPTVVPAESTPGSTATLNAAEQAALANLLVQGQQAKSVATDTAAPYPTEEPTPDSWWAVLVPKNIAPTATAIEYESTATLVTDNQVELTEKPKKERTREPKSTDKPTDEPKSTDKPTDEPKPTDRPTDEPKPTEEPTDRPPLLSLARLWISHRRYAKLNSSVNSTMRGNRGSGADRKPSSTDPEEAIPPADLNSSITNELPPIVDGFLDDNGSRDFQAEFIASSGPRPNRIGFLQFPFMMSKHQRVERALLRLTVMKIRRPFQQSTSKLEFDLLNHFDSAQSWNTTGTFLGLSNATPIASFQTEQQLDVIQQGNELQLSIGCSSLQKLNEGVQAGVAWSKLGIRIRATSMSINWHSKEYDIDESYRPRLQLDLIDDVGGTAPTPCPRDGSVTPTQESPSQTQTPLSTGTPTVSGTPEPTISTTTTVTTATPDVTATNIPSITPGILRTATVLAATPTALAPTVSSPTVGTPSGPRPVKAFLPRVLHIASLNPPRVLSSGDERIALAACHSKTMIPFVLAARANTILRSDDGGFEWREVARTDGVPGAIQDITVTPDCRHVAVAMWGGGILSSWWSNDNFPKLHLIQNKTEGLYPYVLASTNSKLYYGSTLANHDKGGVFMADVPTQGTPAVWQPLGNPSDTVDIRTLLAIGVDTTDTVIAGTTNGPKRFDEMTQAWKSEGLGLEDEPVRALLADRTALGVVLSLAGTDKRGLQALDLAKGWQDAAGWPEVVREATVLSISEGADPRELVVVTTKDNGTWYIRSGTTWMLVGGSKVRSFGSIIHQGNLLVATGGGVQTYRNVVSSLP